MEAPRFEKPREEQIAAAAVSITDAEPIEGETLFLGNNHNEAKRKLFETLGPIDSSVVEEGFYTTGKRIVSRMEALAIAARTKQVEEEFVSTLENGRGLESPQVTFAKLDNTE